jgi:hypothetical protein
VSGQTGALVLFSEFSLPLEVHLLNDRTAASFRKKAEMVDMSMDGGMLDLYLEKDLH